MVPAAPTAAHNAWETSPCRGPAVFSGVHAAAAPGASWLWAWTSTLNWCALQGVSAADGTSSALRSFCKDNTLLECVGLLCESYLYSWFSAATLKLLSSVGLCLLGCGSSECCIGVIQPYPPCHQYGTDRDQPCAGQRTFSAICEDILSVDCSTKIRSLCECSLQIAQRLPI